ncbi:MAG: TrkH family potassium uptake protein [Desulfobulbaceae bacterium]|nr:TrkH family potassium uptake protein [Desulfobulbaceae bacterium]
MGQQVESLRFAVRSRVLLKYFGQLSFLFAILTTAPFFFSLLTGEYHLGFRYGIVIAVSAVLGYLLNRVDAPDDMQDNEALVLSAAIFIFTPLLISFPMMGSGLSFVDALFEAVSGVTTTGLSTLGSVEQMPRTFLLSRAWLQWVGGLGIVVLSVAFLLPQCRVRRRLFVGNWEEGSLLASTKTYARLVLNVYLLLTISGIAALLILGVDWFNALTHILAAVSTGGFSTYDDSLSGLGGWYAQAVVTLFCFLGAVPLGIYYHSFQQGWQEFFGDGEIRTLFCAGITVTILLVLCMHLLDGFSLQDALRHGPLLAFSAQTTAGFASVTVADLSPASKLLLLVSMMVGGNVGSTAGGIKILRLIIVCSVVKMIIVRSGMPAHAVTEPHFMGRRFEAAEIERAFCLFVLFVAVVLFSWLPFIVMGYDPVDALFEIASATGTVGLSVGLSAADLPVLLKGVLCVDMLMGRLEMIALLTLFYPGTWLGKRKREKS